MKINFTLSIKQINFLLLLTCGLSTIGQRETKIPAYLGENSRNTLNEVQNNMDSYKNDKGFNPVENVIVIASNDFRNINFNELEQENTIENLLAVPTEELTGIDNQINNEVLNNPAVVLTQQEIEFWNVFRRMINLPHTEVHIGKTYGDPHIQTYDGYNYSFQTVGEYTLSTNKKGNFEIQVRQEASGSSVSLNTATAMNVNGDTISIYAKNHPDEFRDQPIRVNSEVYEIKNTSYLLDNGGVIKINGKHITVLWPTGEQVLVKMANNFINVVPKVYTSNNGEYFGLLGNANGNPSDDLKSYGGDYFKASSAFYDLSDVLSDKKVKNRKIKAEKAYNAKLIKNFGNSWRITNHSSLFLYKPNENTLTYTDYLFPKEQFSLADKDKSELRKAKKECERAGVSDNEMEGCISDIITTQDVSFAHEAALLSNNEEILLRDFNTRNQIRKLPTIEEVRKKEIARKEISRKKEIEDNRENRITNGSVIRTVATDESSNNEKPTINVIEREEHTISLPSTKKPNNSNPISKPISNPVSKPIKTKSSSLPVSKSSKAVLKGGK